MARAVKNKELIHTRLAAGCIVLNAVRISDIYAIRHMTAWS